MDRYLVTSDVHFTDAQQDQYRWGLFKWLDEQAERNDVSAIFILGDLTNAKDRHPGALVNKVVSGINFLARKAGRSVVVLKGNHDYDQNEAIPFWQFLETLEGVTYVSESELVSGFYFIPHSRVPMHMRSDVSESELKRCRAVFLHETFTGCTLESGGRMEGGATLPGSMRDLPVMIFSGDIHVPQTMRIRGSRIEYVGSPYHVRFGDRFEPRVLLLSAYGNKFISDNLEFPAPRRMSVVIGRASRLSQLGLRTGDQLKVTLRMSPASQARWKREAQDVESLCEEMGVSLYRLNREVVRRVPLMEAEEAALSKPLSPQEVVDKFCSERNVGETVAEVGRELVQQ